MAYSPITKASDFFNTKLWTGTGAENAITGVGFQPDWVWIKNRAAAENHKLYDAVRGATKNIYSNLTNAEGTDAQSLKSFDSDGFTLGTESALNANGQGIVGWNWKANGTGVANTAGSINSTVSANTTSGFSIVKYTGTGSNATVGHGLGVAPSMIITKSLVASQEWCVYHKSLGATKYLFLNETSAEQTGSVYWQDTAPDANVFSVGASGPTNSASAMIAYCFAEIPGFSKFGLYEGNGNSNGPFVYTGFKPSFMMVKAKGQTESWYILDNKRPGYNTNNYYLNPNTNSAEGTSTTLANSLLSNGFKPNNNDTSMNTSGQGYIYMAFGQTLVGSNNIPANAR